MRRVSRNSEEALEPVAVGIDSLYLSSFIDGLGIDWEALRFEKEKLRLSPGRDHSEIEFGGEQFALHRGGCRPYSFLLSNRAFQLQLGENIQPRCHAQFRSQLLWLSGLEGALDRYEAIWRNLGCTLTRPHVVSRVDAAFDFHVPSPDFRTEHFLSQAGKDATWRENTKAQSLQFGKDQIVCRVYDKVAEIEQQSEKDWLFDIWGRREGVWRCEFQIRGERLKEAGIAHLNQLKAYLPLLVKHLARSHTSLRRPTQDSNRSRWPLHPMWKGIIASADRLTNPLEEAPPPLLRGGSYSLYKQVQSVLGSLKGLAATLSEQNAVTLVALYEASEGLGGPPYRNKGGPPQPLEDPPAEARQALTPVSLETLLQRLPHLFAPYHSPELWEREVREKMRRRELGL
ncbi:MAG: hypothetical protein JOY77_08540 [Alphaproteobacteria bacterium]|nr:hypothetical protein [Alphaproteobacteria bacterium]